MITFLLSPQEVARDVAAAIRADPDRHYQGLWFGRLGHLVSTAELRALLRDPGCGTTACVAGWTLAVALPDSAMLYEGSQLITYVKGPEAGDIFRGSFWAVAAAALGINWNEEVHTVPWLFEGERTRREVLSVLDDIAAGRGYDDDREREGL